MKKYFLPTIAAPLLLSPKSKVGGQAIIEGVMMRGHHKISWAVRKPDSELVVESFPYVSLGHKYPILKLPVIRGAISLFESLSIGYKALSRSVEIAMPEEVKTKKDGSKDTFSGAISMIAALLVSLGLFMYLPMFIAQLFYKNSAMSFNLFAGAIRIFLFLAYLIGISFWKDIRRVFEYHGAEHKAIFTFEAKKELTLENMRPFKTLHPRCGTSFLLLVAIICILLFSIIDSLFMHYIGPYPNIISRFLVHLLLIPLISGCSYEVLRFSEKYQHVFPISILIKPGLWLQLITTKEPDDKQLETASAALKAAL
jgi:uncharacterized protein YqhQ